MAPTLRTSTQRKTERSAKAASNMSRVHKTHKQLYKHNKGLLCWKNDQDRDAISIANATNSPLLRLPPEIRNRIFKYASRSPFSGYLSLIYDEYGHACLISTCARWRTLRRVAFQLPRVCRQIYAETATLIYSENLFGFISEQNMRLWLSRRLLGQREAIRYIVLPRDFYSSYQRGWDEPSTRIRETAEHQLRKTCPNLIKMCKNGNLDYIFEELMEEFEEFEDFED